MIKFETRKVISEQDWDDKEEAEFESQILEREKEEYERLKAKFESKG